MNRDHCLLDRDGHVLTVTLNRPEAKNALSSGMLAGMYRAWRMLDDDPGLRVAILTGRGDVFCAGADLKSMGAGETDDEFMQLMSEVPDIHWQALLRHNRPLKPIIAAVEGFAVAGGTEILQGTDIRVAAEGAVFGVWEAKRGLFPLGGSACRLPRQIPYTHAMDILLRCPPVPAREAREIGLVGHVVPDGQALARAKELAAEVAEMAPLSTKAILRAWRETEHMKDAEAMQHQDKIGWEVFASEDAQEGPKAFGEKRPPVFQGK